MLTFLADVFCTVAPVSTIRSTMSRQRRFRLPPLGISALLVYSLSACSGGGSDPVVISDSPTTPLRENLSIEPSSFILTEGDKVALTGKLGSTALGASQLSWSVSPSNVATVDPYGNLTAIRHGEATVTARYTSLTATANATVWAIPTRITTERSSNISGIVGRSVPDSVGIRAENDEGVPVPGVDVMFEVLSGDGTISHTTQTTGLDGVARTDWALGTQAGSQGLKARSDGLGELTVFADAIPDYDSAMVASVLGDEQDAEVATVLPENLRAQVTDQFGNILPGLAVDWKVTHGGALAAANGGTWESVFAAVTDAEGVVEAVWQLGTVSGDQEASLDLPGAPNAVQGLGLPTGPNAAKGGEKGRNVLARWKAKAKPGFPDKVVVSPEETRTLVDVHEKLIAKLVDAYGNPIEGSDFRWEDDGMGVVEVDGDGNIFGRTVGTAQVTAFSNVVNLAGAAIVVVEHRMPSSMHRGAGNGQTGSVGEPLPDPVGVRVLDQVGAPVAGVEVSWAVVEGMSAVSGPGPSAVHSSGQVGASVSVTDENGIAMTDWTLGTRAGPQGLRADVAGTMDVEFEAQAVPGAVVALTVEPASAEVDVGKTHQFTVSAQDAYGNPVPNAAIQWGSSAETVAVVSTAGMATGVAEGTTQIMAVADEASAEATLTVVQAPDRVRSVEVDPSSFTLVGIGRTGTLAAVARDSLGAEVSDAEFTWNSLDPSIVTVGTEGVVTAMDLGEARIVVSTACCSAADTATVWVDEAPEEAPEVTVEASPASVVLGSLEETATLTAVALDSQALPVQDVAFIWSSLNPAVATVDSNGVVTSKAPGEALIVASADCCVASDTVTVTVEGEGGSVPAIASVELTPHETTITGLGSIVTLAAVAKDSLGAEVQGVTFEWTSLQPSIATVDDGGVVTSKALGQAVIVASAICCTAADSSVVRVEELVLNQPEITTQSPLPEGAVGAFYDVSFTATGGEGAYSWSLGAGSSLPPGLTLNGSTGELTGTPSSAGTTDFVVQVSSDNLTSEKPFAITVSAASEPVTGDTVALSVMRMDGGTGSALVSNGIPLKPGMLYPGETDNVAVLVDGVEQAIHVEALKGLHTDGSLRSILVQFYAEVTGVGPSGSLVVGPAVQRNLTDIQATPVEWDLPQAVALPTNPDYLVSTLLVGPTITTDDIPAGLAFQTSDAKFVEYSDYHWSPPAAWTDNYYDRAWNHYAYWVRSGDALYWYRATELVTAYRKEYLEPNYGTAPRNFQPDGLAAHYWLTGSEPSRAAVIGSAKVLSGGFTPERAWNTDHYGTEGRIQQRVLLGELYSWLLEDTSWPWLEMMDHRMAGWIDIQLPNGAWDYDINPWDDGQVGYGQSNFMEALRLSGMIAYYFIRNPDAGTKSAIVNSIKGQADYLWSVEWDSYWKSFHYWSQPEWENGDAQVRLDWARELNGLFAQGFAFAYWATGETAYLDRADLMFEVGVSNQFYGGSKQFNQQYYSTFNYLWLRNR